MVDPASVETYDVVARDYLAEYDEPSEQLDAFASRLPAGGRVLDAGCGVGVDAGSLAGRGFDVVGLDRSPGMLTVAADRCPDASFVRGDLRALPFAPGAFDGVIASFSLINVPKADLPATLGSIATVLRPGGHLFLGMQAGESGELTVTEPLDPGREVFLNVVSESELDGLLAEAGFEPVERFRRDPGPDEFDYRKLVVVARATSEAETV